MKMTILKNILLTAICFLITIQVASAADLVKYAVCDVEVLYLYEDEAEIDWPTIYYLNDNFGCRVDLLKIIQRTKFEISTTEVKNKQLYHHVASLPNADSTSIKN